MQLKECIERAEIEKKSFAFNEITGMLVCIGRNNKLTVILDGDSSNEKFIRELLFDDEQILNTWNLLSDDVVTEFLDRNVWSKKTKQTSNDTCTVSQTQFRNIIKRIIALAGNPDSSQACRNIISECKLVLSEGTIAKNMAY